MGAKLELALLGPPQIRLAGDPLTGFKTRKAQALLFYLAVTGHAHSRTSLAGLLWGDMPEVAHASTSASLYPNCAPRSAITWSSNAARLLSICGAITGWT